MESRLRVLQRELEIAQRLAFILGIFAVVSAGTVLILVLALLN